MLHSVFISNIPHPAHNQMTVQIGIQVPGMCGLAKAPHSHGNTKMEPLVQQHT